MCGGSILRILFLSPIWKHPANPPPHSPAPISQLPSADIRSYRTLAILFLSCTLTQPCCDQHSYHTTVFFIQHLIGITKLSYLSTFCSISVPYTLNLVPGNILKYILLGMKQNQAFGPALIGSPPFRRNRI